jgi:arginyl-tRNA synthetase
LEVQKPFFKKVFGRRRQKLTVNLGSFPNLPNSDKFVIIQRLSRVTMKETIIELLEKQLKKLNADLEAKGISEVLRVPPSNDLGDYSFPCFILSKALKQNPAQIANVLAGQIEKTKGEEIEKIEVKGPYINFFLNKSLMAQKVVREVEQKKEDFCKGNKKIGKIMVEFPAPNTNKPLHMGHLRNMAIGESISRILEFNHNKVIRVNLNNDRGIHICKSMLAYQTGITTNTKFTPKAKK